ncbi:MAG: GLPGLI family protein [Flavobacterium sp.]|nr:GLPGLI family protein [Flavobacterium sp.]
MNKLILLMTFFLTSISARYTYYDDKAVAQIVYDFKHMRDTEKPSLFYEEEMCLFFNKNSSLYTSYTKLKQDAIMEEQFKNLDIRGNYEINLGVRKPYTLEQMFIIDNSGNRYLNNKFRGNNFIITERTEKISWTIVNESKKIIGYSCQKATCHFKGRDYIAWFTNSIPQSLGPWKLNGLPGLILEASDLKRQVVFMCKSVDLTVANHIDIKLPKSSLKITKNEYEKMVNAYQESIKNGDAGSSLDGVTIKQVDGFTKTKTPFKINNPIELTEN